VSISPEDGANNTPAGNGVHQLDGGTLGCARLLLLLRDHAARLPDGTVIHLTTTDPVAPIDLPTWCRMTGHTYLGVVPGPGKPTYAVQVTATPAPTHPDAPWKTAR
jgi:tRNA 2-thiouridine synthesizing protein A